MAKILLIILVLWAFAGWLTYLHDVFCSREDEIIPDDADTLTKLKLVLLFGGPLCFLLRLLYVLAMAIRKRILKQTTV